MEATKAAGTCRRYTLAVWTQSGYYEEDGRCLRVLCPPPHLSQYWVRDGDVELGGAARARSGWGGQAAAGTGSAT